MERGKSEGTLDKRVIKCFPSARGARQLSYCDDSCSRGNIKRGVREGVRPAILSLTSRLSEWRGSTLVSYSIRKWTDKLGVQDGLRAQRQHLPGAADRARHGLLQRARLARGGLATGEEGRNELE